MLNISQPIKNTNESRSQNVKFRIRKNKANSSLHFWPAIHFVSYSSQNLLTPFTTMPIFSIINPFGFITLFISIVPYGLPSSCRRFSRPPRILPSLLLFRSIFHDRRRLHFQNSRNPGPRTSSSFCPSCRRSRCSATPPSFSLFQLRVSNCI